MGSVLVSKLMALWTPVLLTDIRRHVLLVSTTGYFLHDKEKLSITITTVDVSIAPSPSFFFDYVIGQDKYPLFNILFIRRTFT